MGVLEQINKLKEQGVSEENIIGELRQKNVSPKEINEALNQSKIKNAVSGISGQNTQQNMEKSKMPTQKTQSKTQEVNENQDYYNPQQYAPQQPTQQQPSEQDQSYQNYEQQYQNYPEQQGQSYPSYPEQQYPNYEQQYQNYPEQQGQYYEEYPEYSSEYGGYDYGNTDTFIEIAEQVFSEKIKDIDKKIDELNQIKSIAKVKLDHVDDRLKRIESAFDKLQAAILNKVGSYGNTLEGIKKEMSMLEDSFGKIASHSKTKTPKKTSKKPQKKKTTKKSSKKKKSS